MEGERHDKDALFFSGLSAFSAFSVLSAAARGISQKGVL